MTLIEESMKACYSKRKKKDGIAIMPNSEKVKKTNSEIVKAYHSQLTNVRVRFPNEEACGIDYLEMMRKRAKELGFIIEKGKDKGEGSVNAYILHLVETDLGITMQKRMTEVTKSAEE